MTDDTSAQPPLSHPIGAHELRGRAPVRHSLRPDAQALERLCAALGLLALRKVELRVELTPEGRRDWRLEGQLGATVVQPCVVSLAPVTTRIEEPVTRLYVAGPDPHAQDEGEIELSGEDIDSEPLAGGIDLGAVLSEALALALPLYPHAEGAELGEARFAAPGQAPMSDEAARPFAGLAALRDRLADEGDD